MRICYLTQYLDPMTGGGRYASDLVLGVKKAGHEVIILKEEDDGFAGEAILKRGPGLIFSALRVRRRIENCDIIHALDGYPYAVMAYIANLFCGKKLVVTAQGTYAIAPLYSPKTKYILERAYSSADVVTAISRYTKNELLKKIKRRDVEVINHGINLSRFEGESSRISNQRENFIMSVGGLKKRKGHHISIPAFALAKKKIPNLKYKIVGDQGDVSYVRELKSLAAKYGVTSDIEFMSWIPDEKLMELYRKAKIFILTSVNCDHHIEGFGLVFLEAASAGAPVIGTFGNGIEDAVRNGYNGILVSQNDIAKTASAIIEIASDETKWDTMSRNSFLLAKEHDLNLVIKKYVAIYARTLSQNS